MARRPRKRRSPEQVEAIWAEAERLRAEGLTWAKVAEAISWDDRYPGTVTSTYLRVMYTTRTKAEASAPESAPRPERATVEAVEAPEPRKVAPGVTAVVVPLRPERVRGEEERFAAMCAALRVPGRGVEAAAAEAGVTRDDLRRWYRDSGRLAAMRAAEARGRGECIGVLLDVARNGERDADRIKAAASLLQLHEVSTHVPALDLRGLDTDDGESPGAQLAAAARAAFPNMAGVDLMNADVEVEDAEVIGEEVG